MELKQYLSNVWNQVWVDNGKVNYANLRLLKISDKIKNISAAGVNFQEKKILDIGCGNGVTLFYLRKFFNIRGVGVDISDSIVRKLKDSVKDPNLSFYLGDHRNLHMLESNQFDVILSFGVIEHFEEYGLALAEARRVLKPGGKIVLVQPHLLSFGVTQEYYLRLIGRWKFGKQKDFSLFRYRSILQQVGFEDVQAFTKPPYPDMRITRILDSIVKKVIPIWGHYLYLIGKK